MRKSTSIAIVGADSHWRAAAHLLMCSLRFGPCCILGTSLAQKTEVLLCKIRITPKLFVVHKGLLSRSTNSTNRSWRQHWNGQTQCSALAVSVQRLLQPLLYFNFSTALPDFFHKYLGEAQNRVMNTEEDVGPNICEHQSLLELAAPEEEERSVRPVSSRSRNNAVSNSWREDTCYKIVVFESVSRKRCQPAL